MENLPATKMCKACGKEKSRTEFPKHVNMADGLLNKCKSCVKEDKAVYRRKNRTKVREGQYEWRRNNADRVRVVEEEYRRRNSDRLKKYQAEYRKLPHAKEAKRAAIQQWREENPEKARAHNIANLAVREGTLVAPKKCSVCNKVRKLQKHHEDYSKPLEVDWVCDECHKKITKTKRDRSR